MPFSGAPGNKNFSRTTGFYNGPTAWQQTEQGGRDILAIDEDVHDQDIAAAIDNSLQKDGSNHPIGDIPMASYKFTGLSYSLSYGDSVPHEQLMQSTPFSMSAGRLAVTANANVLTISLLGLDGNPPTAAKPVIVNLHSITTTNGLPQLLKVSSALSMTVSAGSTLGAPALSPIKLRVAIFADGAVDGAGTPRLAVMYGSASGTYDQFGNALAEGGAGAADSAGVWYSPVAISSKPYRVIGTAVWAPPGLAVAGNWTGPTYVSTQAQDEALPFSDNLMPVGVVLPYAGTAFPAGWLACNGQAISRATYARLFGVIGTGFGVGDGSTTFNVPDLMGRVVAGVDLGTEPGGPRLYATGLINGMDKGTIGGVGGHQYHTLTDLQLGLHQHFMDHNHVPLGGGQFRTTLGGVNNVATPIAGTNAGDDLTTGAASVLYTNNNAGGQSHNNVQPTLVMNYMIYTGV